MKKGSLLEDPAAADNPEGEATDSMLWEDEFWQISQLGSKTSKAEWWRANESPATQVLGESLERFQNPDVKSRNQFLQRGAYSPSIADQKAFQILSSPARDSSPEERGNPSLRPLQQWGDWHPPQVDDQQHLSLPQLTEALKQLGVVQKPGDQQLVGGRPEQGDWSPPPNVQQPLRDLQQQGVWPQPLNMQPLGMNQQPGWGQQQQPQWGPQQAIIAPPFRATFDEDSG